MINERILNEFREHNTDPRYIVLITDMQNGEPICNEESLIISTKQIYTSLEEYLQNPDDTIYKTIERDLTIYSNIGLNDNNLYVGELNGYISKENVKELQQTSSTESSHWIEIIDTVLQKTIDITFNRRYENIPKVIITIDESDEKLYRNYSTSFVKDNDCLYTGVQITFNNLKNKNSYPKLGVTIIGDEKTEKYDDEGNLLPEYKELTLNLFYTVFNEEKNEDEDIPIIGHTITIDENEYVTNKCGTITEQFVVGEHSISIPDYTDENDVIHYSNIEGLIQNLENNTIIPVEFSLTPAGEDNDSG